MTTVLTMIERDEHGAIAGSSEKLLTFARGVAQAEGAELHAAVVGAIGDQALATLREQGVAAVHVVEHDLLADYAPAAWAAALHQLSDRLAPRMVVTPSTARGSEVIAHLAARTDLPLAANCLEIHAVDGGWELTRQRWGGILLEDARLEAALALISVVPHGTDATPADVPGAAEVHGFVPEVDEELAVTRVRERVTASSGVSLATAPVVVSGGRGVGSAEGFALLEELAALLGGAVGCSRVATNNGWRSHNDQVGQTGTRVAPELYIALGISGATQHWVGCMSSKRILAVNTDADAPMVTRADFAVLGDLHALLPALVEEVRKRKAVTV
jgi:electron transfer flavoprotein alpha subunit